MKMTEIIIGGAQSYTLCLDSIDLTYLSKYGCNPKDEKRPIWSKRRLDGESEYYEVQIIAQDINRNDSFSESSETYKCNICNLEVPKICYKEHNESIKHETYKKIWENVFERVSKQINLSIINNDREIPKDVYYCVPCSKLIKIENKYKHEASDYHTNSLEKIKVLHDFYEIFTENELNASYFEKLNMESDSKRNNIEIIKYDIEYYNRNNSTFDRNGMDTENDIPSPISETDSGNTGSLTLNSMSVEKFDYCEICQINVPESRLIIHNAGVQHWSNLVKKMCTGVANELRANIDSEKNDSITVSGWPQNKNIPESTLKNENATISDVSNTEINVSKADAKVAAFSKYLKYSDDTKTKVECTICDIKIPKTERHIMEHIVHRNHVENANKGVMGKYKDLWKYIDDTNTTVKCIVCDVSMLYVDQYIIKHMQGRFHEKNMAKEQIKEYYKVLNHSNSLKNYTRCRICDATILRVENNIVEHMESENHLESEKKLLIFHTIKKEAIKKYFCQCCEKSVTIFFTHINTTAHTKKFQSKYRLNRGLLKQYVYNHKETLESSEAILYRELYKNLLLSNRIISLDSIFYCNVCDTELAIETEIDHALSARHWKRFCFYND